MNPKPTAAELNRDRLRTSDVVKEIMAAEQKKLALDDFDTILVKKINKLAIDTFNEFRLTHKLNVVPMKKTDALEIIRRKYRDGLVSWSKDELQEALALTLASLGVEAFHNELV